MQILFTFLSVPLMASNTLASPSSPSTNVCMDTGVTLHTRHFFLWASTSDCLTIVSRILTEWTSSSFNIAVCGVFFNVRIGKYFGLKNFMFYIQTVLTKNDRFVCILSFTVFIFHAYITTVTKLRICTHHLLFTIIFNILQCVTLCHLTIKWVLIIRYNLYKLSLILKKHWRRSFVDRKCCHYILCSICIGIVVQSSRLLYFILFELHRHVSTLRYPLSSLVGRFPYTLYTNINGLENNPKYTKQSDKELNTSYINVWKSSQSMNLRDFGSETSVDDTVQTNKKDK